MIEFKSSGWYHCDQQSKSYLQVLVWSLSGLYSAVGRPVKVEYGVDGKIASQQHGIDESTFKIDHNRYVYYC